MLYLGELSSRALQEQDWLEKKNDSNDAYGIDPIVHFIFDDTNLGSDPASEIGDILFDKSEADVVGKVAHLLSAIIDKLGDAGSAAFIADSSWPELAECAGSGLKFMAGREAATWAEE